MERNILLTGIIILLVSVGFSGAEKKCIMTGTVTDRNSKSLILIKAHEDPRSGKEYIPIINGKFSYELEFSHTEAYSLIFEDEFKSGGFRPVTFFPIDGEIIFELYPKKDYTKNRIDGGKINAQFQKHVTSLENHFNALTQHLQDSISTLYQTNSYYSAPMNDLYMQLKNSKNQKENIRIYNEMEVLRKSGQVYSPLARDLSLKIKMVIKSLVKEKYRFMAEDQTVLSYYFLLDDLMREYDKEIYDIETMRNLQHVLSQKYKEHPYNELTMDLLNSIVNLRVGKKYIDFTLPDIFEKKYTLSQEIEGKFALIDIWAPWCGPCIATSRSMIPVFEEFENDGFTVVGVVGQFNNFKNVKARLESENYPWLTLIESDSKNSIWKKYGLQNSGGGTFLVDKAGKIVAINPTADEVKAILHESIKEKPEISK